MHRKTQPIDQKGVVSFMVTLIMMMVITLIVIGFTQVTMRSRREALDKQLSSQAFYAAESGVNKAVAVIKNNPGAPIAHKDNCADGPTDVYNGFELDGTNVEVTCIMVSSRPSSIVGKATQNSSFITQIKPVEADGTASSLDELTFTWSLPDAESGAGSSCTAADGAFAPGAGTCKFGLLRVDMLSVDAAGVYDFNKTMTFYMQPRQGSPETPAVNDISHYTVGRIVSASCSTEKCAAKLSGLGNNTFYIRMSTLYRDAKSVTITGKLASMGTAYFEDAQAVIDATGRAQDVLRRVQVRYPLGRADDTPPWAVAGSVCKRLTVAPGTVIPDGLCP